MEIGNQIKHLRLRRGITQDTMAQHLGVTPQAVSKWERGAATPDISLLPELSAYFGVTIDELFALSDDTRMERIQNMIWDVRYFDPADVEKERQFLLEKAKCEHENDKVFELLADMENHLAREHHDFAAEYAQEALKRNPYNKSAHASLVEAMGGQFSDWYMNNHFDLILFYKEFVKQHPKAERAYMWLMDHLLDAGRIVEAAEYFEAFQKLDNSFRTPWYQGQILWHQGNHQDALACWDKMLSEFSDDWMSYFAMGDILARRRDYERAKDYYRQAISKQNAPTFTDPYESIAQVCELQGNIQEAIDVLKEELEIQKEQWNVTYGETADTVRRKITRLERLL